ncbi:10855_t:CDS:1, partial [Gigaspora rosea]
KGIFLTWLKEQNEKLKQHIKPATLKMLKSDIVNKEMVELVTNG